MFGDLLAPTHVLLIMIVALLVLGPKRLPEVGRSLGKGLRDFREAMTSYNPGNLLNGEDEPAAATPSEVYTPPKPATPSEVYAPPQPAAVAAQPEPQDADVVEKPAG
jgi:sec-independent protein translocase protein TatA